QNRAQGKLEVPQLGVTVQAFTRDMAQQLGLRGVRGVIVTEVDAGGRAQASGAKVGDIVVSANGQAVTGPDQFAGIAAKTDFGTGLRLEVVREMMGFFNKGYIDTKD